MQWRHWRHCHYTPPCLRYTGYESLIKSHSGLRYLCTGASMVQRQSKWHLCCSAFPVYILANDFALLRLLTWWCHGQFAPPSVHERSFQSAAASTWNALSHSVRSSTSVLQFRSQLETELFARSYQQSYWICLCVCDSTFLFRDLEVFGFTSRQWRF